MGKTIHIGSREIGAGQPPFVVAEMSGNHNQSLGTAIDIIRAAAQCGAHAVKLQTYTADVLTINEWHNEFFIDNKKSPWKGQSLHTLYQRACTPYEWHEVLFKEASACELPVFSTPFDETAVDFLEALGAPAYKIASFENNHLALIRRAAATGKPLIISTGMATLAELDDAVTAARQAGCRDLILLKCVSAYPAAAADMNLATIPHLRQLFDCEVGLSDHTRGSEIAVAAVALGACMIEKHITLSRALGGVDASFSVEPNELDELVTRTLRAWQAVGSVHYGITEAEKSSAVYRRSVYAVVDIRAGEVLTTANIRVIRPGLGLAPKYYDVLVGKTAAVDISRGTPINWDMI
jgi:N-acetylneuraminate synthase